MRHIILRNSYLQYIRLKIKVTLRSAYQKQYLSAFRFADKHIWNEKMSEIHIMLIIFW